MFISEPYRGNWFVAQRTERSQGRVNGLRWLLVPIGSVAGETRISPRQVPYHIRRQAYRRLGR